MLTSSHLIWDYNGIQTYSLLSNCLHFLRGNSHSWCFKRAKPGQMQGQGQGKVVPAKPLRTQAMCLIKHSSLSTPTPLPKPIQINMYRVLLDTVFSFSQGEGLDEFHHTSSEVQPALKSFSFGWFMLLLNHKCSYKTFCAAPAATCPHSLCDFNTGHLRSCRNGLRRLRTVSRGWDMLCVDLPSEKPTAWPGRGDRMDGAEAQQGKLRQHLQPWAPCPGGTQTLPMAGKHSQMSKEGAVTALNNATSTLRNAQVLLSHSENKQGDRSRSCALGEQQWKASDSACAQPEQGAALE